ncbi:MAG: hypothetical protein SH820_08680, partial [Xanthomonadales bacterium]|nr:hypothetical protein [Xanthomonadales bacterium]
MRTKNTGVSKLAVLLVTIGLAFAAVMVLSGAWPPGEGNMAGTIAPAERYQSDQISDEDVVLGDESVAKIMQTDEFEQSVNSTEVASSGANAAADDGRARA